MKEPLFEDWPLTEDGIFGRAVTIFQHRKGYRFSIDAVLLAAFALERALLSRASLHAEDSSSPDKQGLRLLDLCTGSAIVPLATLFLMKRLEETSLLQGDSPEETGSLGAVGEISFRGDVASAAAIFSHAWAVEVQDSMAQLARANIEANHQEKLTLIHADLRAWEAPHLFDVVTCNPPYQPVEAGDVSKHPERAVARHEIHGRLQEIVQAAKELMHPEGRSLWVFPADRGVRLQRLLVEAGLRLTHQRLIHPFEDSAPNLLLLEACHAHEASPSKAASKRSDPAQDAETTRLVLYKSHRVYTPVMDALLQGDPIPWLRETLRVA
ncbi:MAG: hypothetical protein H6728_17575 [Myxococcales bacterium]|nr:hypothetical protein [Myxococcales bacterium]